MEYHENSRDKHNRGPYLGGNYWSDYLGNDTNGDGLGDTLIPHGGDWLPLTEVEGTLQVRNLDTGEDFEGSYSLPSSSM